VGNAFNGIHTLSFNDPARASTLLLSSLMVIGLFFFIRASTKDRIEVAQFTSMQEADALRQAVMSYFYSRAYQPPSKDLNDKLDDSLQPAFDAAPKVTKGAVVVNGTTLVGLVSPSLFMAAFLSALAAVGLACLSLIVATLFPAWGGWLLALVGASPLAGVFYWKKSSRPETVVLRVDSLADVGLGSETSPEISPEASPEISSETDPKTGKWMSKLTVQGHRDELADLENAFSQPKLKAWAQLEKIAQG
jgi:hypothetical protein